MFFKTRQKGMEGFRRLGIVGNVYNFPSYGAVGNTVCRMWESDAYNLYTPPP